MVARLKPAVEKSIFGRLPGGTIVRIEPVIHRFRGVCYRIEVQRTGSRNLVSLEVDGAPDSREIGSSASRRHQNRHRQSDFALILAAAVGIPHPPGLTSRSHFEAVKNP